MGRFDSLGYLYPITDGFHANVRTWQVTNKISGLKPTGKEKRKPIVNGNMTFAI
jgi:hypothetical protein